MLGHLLVRNSSTLRQVTRIVWLTLLVLLVTAPAGRATTAQAGPPVIFWERSVEMDDAALLHPIGLAASPLTDAFYLVELGAAGNEDATTTINTVTAFGERLGAVTLPLPPTQARHLTYDTTWRRLLLWDADHHELLSVAAHDDGVLDPATLTRHATAHWNVQNAVGIAFDTLRGHLYLLDRDGPRLLRVEPTADGGFAGATVTAFDLATPLNQPQGLAYDPTRDHLQVVAQGTQSLYELTLNGEVVAERNLAPFALSGVGGMVFAPSADLTDDPQQHNLFFADHGFGLRLAEDEIQSLGRSLYLPLVTTDATAGDQAEPAADSHEPPSQRGQLVEFSLVEMNQPEVQAAAAPPTLVQTMDASLWSPPSPDPSGIVYLPNSGALLVSDGEVEESVLITQSGQLTLVTLYEGVNMWHITPAGAVVSTWDTQAFSDEPIGVALNPANQHLFISDDNGPRGVYEVNPGPDGIYGNVNDVVSFFRTGTANNSEGFGSLDPEGVAYAPDSGHLFIADGTNHQVYRVSPGINGIFDGVPPAGDDEVTDFDTETLGLTSPEGIAYYPITGNLFLVGRPDNLLFEVTATGSLVQTYDVTQLNAKSLADLTFAPGSQNPSAMSIYIVDRGIDNNALPDMLPNDGKVYEIALMPAANDDTVVTDEDTPVTIDVAANDTDADGNPVLGSINNTCTICTSPSNGVLTNSGDGSFVYTPTLDFSGSDGFVYLMCVGPTACDTATVTITVLAVNDAPVADDDTVVTNEDTPVTIDVDANDTDADGNLVPGFDQQHLCHLHKSQ